MITNFINNNFILSIFICIIIHITLGIFLNKIYYKRENKNTPMAFIPLANIFLLVSLAIHDVIGWITLILIILNMNFPIIMDEEIFIKRILPESINETLTAIILVFMILCFLILVFKKKKIKNESLDTNDFLTEAELMKDPSFLKMNAKMNFNTNNKLEPKEPKPIPKFENNQVSMPKPLNQRNSFNNQSQLPTKNPFRRGL